MGFFQRLFQDIRSNSKFNQDVLWNFGSICVLGVSGAALNILIGTLYDAATLGAFNQVLAAYILAAVFAVGGINNSALKFIAENPQDHSRVADISIASSLLTAVCAGLVTAIFWFLIPWIAGLLGSEQVEEGMKWVTPGIFFFALNKTFLCVVNGLHWMKAFAVLQSLRYFNLLLGFGLVTLLKWPGERLPVVFTFSEVILFLVCIFYLKSYWKIPQASQWKQWVPKHLKFGIRGVFSGALLELNARTDILMLGIFLDDRQIGIYSFAALVFEGLMHFLYVLQFNYNPYLSSLLFSKDHAGLISLFRKGRAKVYRYALVAVPLIVLSFPLAVWLFFPSGGGFEEGWLSFGILMAGLLVTSGYVPFHNVFAMAGSPGIQTLFLSAIVFSNLVFNWILIPPFGIAGAALGTAIALGLSIIWLHGFAWRYLGIALHERSNTVGV